MEIRLLNDGELAKVYERHLIPAFPPSELRPLWTMQDMVRRGIYRTWGLLDGAEIVGEAFVWACAPGWGLFDYLCVAPERRGGGLGARLLQAVMEAEAGTVLFGEVEIPEYAPDPVLAARRLDFYRRCGAREATYQAAVFGVPYRVIYCAPEAVNEAELEAVHRDAYRSRLSDKLFERFIRIPWDISMGLPDKHPWEE